MRALLPIVFLLVFSKFSYNFYWDPGRWLLKLIMLHVEIFFDKDTNNKVERKKESLFIYFCYSYNKLAQKMLNGWPILLPPTHFVARTNIHTLTYKQNYESNCVCECLYMKECLFICLFVINNISSYSKSSQY